MLPPTPRGYGGQVAFTKLDAGEIRRIKKTAFASVAKAGKATKTRNAATS